MNWNARRFVNNHPVGVLMNYLDFLTRDRELMSVDNMGDKIIVLNDVVDTRGLIVNLKIHLSTFRLEY